MTTAHRRDDGYEIRDGIIQNLGKFEGEPEYMLDLFESVMDGCSDETLYDGDTPVDVFFVDGELQAKYPALAGVYAVGVYTNESGFVCRLEWATADDYARDADAMEESADASEF